MAGPGSLSIEKTLKGDCGKHEPAYPGDTVVWELRMKNETSDDMSFLMCDPLPTCVSEAEAVVTEVTNGAEAAGGALPLVDIPIFLPAYSSVCIEIKGVIAADAPCPSTTSNCVELKSAIADDDGNPKNYRTFESSEPCQIGDWGDDVHPKFCDRTTVDQTEILFHFLGGNDIDRMQCCLDLLERCVDLCDIINALNGLLADAGKPQLGGLVSPYPASGIAKAKAVEEVGVKAAVAIKNAVLAPQTTEAVAIKLQALSAWGSAVVIEEP